MHILKNKEIKNIGACLYIIGKNENEAKEFVEYYKNYSIDKIFIYNNYDLEGEKFESIQMIISKINLLK